MSVVEQEIVEKFQQLDSETQSRIMETLHQIQEPTLDFGAWRARVATFHSKLRAAYGENYVIGGQELLDELREEAS